ncbi:PAS domain S-box protein [bacterium]|nr:PAS domain S-box protein [bacterium]
MDRTREDQFFKVILSSVADGVFTVDGNRQITSFNPAAERITGITATQAVGKKCYEIFHSDACETGCMLARTMKTGEEAIDKQVNILHKSGRRVPISISTAVLRDPEGEVLGAVETFRDLTPIEELRKQLELSYSFEDIVTKSPAMQKLLNILPDAAESDSTVLIQGPSGSGKELFARAVHNLSRRHEKPLVVINCGTLPPQLVESELFGYKQGAFTDAKNDKPGKIAMAEGGTVFFDEVAEIPMNLQVKLLRLLQEKEYEPVGGLEPRIADIRVVAATNKDLKELVEQSRFREDLYYRLAVIRFDLPPLKQRREDIPILIDHFIRKFNAEKGKDIFGVHPKVMEILMNHAYEGNVRELENIIEYAFAVCHSRTIGLEHLPLELQQPQQPMTAGDGMEPGLPSKHPARTILDEETRIRQVLARHNGNRTRASKELGVDRTTLWRKMKRYGISV